MKDLIIFRILMCVFRNPRIAAFLRRLDHARSRLLFENIARDLDAVAEAFLIDYVTDVIFHGTHADLQSAAISLLLRPRETAAATRFSASVNASS